MCGLLSHTFPPEGGYDLWKRFRSGYYGFESDRVVPVTKQLLGTKPLEFAHAIHLTHPRDRHSELSNTR
jgi:hypothetical protein